MQPTFSIITVTFNAELCIRKTIESVIAQTYPDIEYIIIDGNSPDKTVEIIEEHKDRISFFVSEPDNGLYDAMNKGLRKATGDYVWFLNAGDCIKTPDTVKRIALLSEQYSIPDIIYGETDLTDAHGNVFAERRLRSPEDLSWKSFRMGMLVSHQAFIAKRSISPEFDLKYRFSSDFDWCIRCMKQAKIILNSNRILSNYMEGGLTLKYHKTSLKERYKIMSGYYGKIPTFFMHGWFAIRFYFTKLSK